MKKNLSLTWLALIVFAPCSPFVLAKSSAPPLKPNEQIVTTKDGCGLVVDNSTPHAKFKIASVSQLTWDGPCINGLAMGEGWVSEGDYRYTNLLPARGWAWYGRVFGEIKFKIEGGATSIQFIWDGVAVSYNTLSIANPVWGENRSSHISTGNVSVFAGGGYCYGEKNRFPDCATKYLLDMNTPHISVSGKGITYQKYKCPNPRSTQGCEALWAKHAGPVIERVKVFIAENKSKVAALKRKIAPMIAHWRPAPNARGKAAARHAAIRASQLAERRQREKKQAEADRTIQRLNAETAAQEAENERNRIANEQQAEQDRKEANRRDLEDVVEGVNTIRKLRKQMKQ